MTKRTACVTALAASAALSALACDKPATAPVPAPTASRSPVNSPRKALFDRVLLLSIDGMHQSDFERFVATHPHSALARLAHHGVEYANAFTSRPSDSFPGLLAILTGGTPRSTGVYYDDSYDRRLSPPGSDCSVHGTEVVYDESIDVDPNAIDAGGGIDPKALPLDGSRGCTPVYPHQFLRVNTVFEVVHAAGNRTAWADKHPAYDIVRGPSGKGLDDLYTPEIAADNSIATADVAHATQNDDLKVKAILNEISGLDSRGTTHVGVPVIFGMNFQAVSVGQKTTGYQNASGVPTADLATALEHTDESIGKFVEELRDQHLEQHTLVIVTAKHGQSPIDRQRLRIVSSKLIPGIVNGVQNGLLAQGTQDDVALLWLTDQSQAESVRQALAAQASTAHIAVVLSGAPLAALFGNPTTSSRIPDLIVQPEPGVIYTKVTATKVAEHGGFSFEDTSVPILVAGAGIPPRREWTPVETRQIAPTILRALGFDPSSLQAVVQEGTEELH